MFESKNMNAVGKNTIVNCEGEIADRIEFLAAVQKGLDQLDHGAGIPHDEIKKQLASWLTS